MHRNEGFTLIELMIVVGIIGILATIAVPSFQGYMVRAKRSEAVTMFKAMQTGAEAYYHTEFTSRGLSGSTSTHCTVDHMGGTLIPALPTSATQAGGKQFGDFSTNANTSDIGINQSGMYYYSYQIVGSAGLGQCDLDDSPSNNVYRFIAIGFLNTATDYELVEFNNTVIAGEMIAAPGVVVTQLSL